MYIGDVKKFRKQRNGENRFSNPTPEHPSAFSRLPMLPVHVAANTKYASAKYMAPISVPGHEQA